MMNFLHRFSSLFSSEEKNPNLNILILGPANAGKRSLLCQMKDGTFVEDAFKDAQLMELALQMHQDDNTFNANCFLLRDKSSDQSYLKSIDLVLIVHADDTDLNNDMATYNQEAQTLAPGKACIHILNKTDLLDTTKAINDQVIRASAKTGQGVNEIVAAVIATQSHSHQLTK